MDFTPQMSGGGTLSFKTKKLFEQALVLFTKVACDDQKLYSAIFSFRFITTPALKYHKVLEKVAELTFLATTITRKSGDGLMC